MRAMVTTLGAVRCGAVRCGAVRCGAVRCGAVRCGAGAVRCGAVRCGARRAAVPSAVRWGAGARCARGAQRGAVGCGCPARPGAQRGQVGCGCPARARCPARSGGVRVPGAARCPARSGGVRVPGAVRAVCPGGPAPSAARWGAAHRGPVGCSFHRGPVRAKWVHGRPRTTVHPGDRSRRPRRSLLRRHDRTIRAEPGQPQGNATAMSEGEAMPGWLAPRNGGKSMPPRSGNLVRLHRARAWDRDRDIRTPTHRCRQRASRRKGDSCARRPSVTLRTGSCPAFSTAPSHRVGCPSSAGCSPPRIWSATGGPSATGEPPITGAPSRASTGRRG